MRSRIKNESGEDSFRPSRAETSTHEIMGLIYIVVEKLIVSHDLVIIIQIISAHIAF